MATSRYIEMDFIDENVQCAFLSTTSYWGFFEMVRLTKFRMGSDIASVPKRQKLYISNADPIHQRSYASPGLDALSES